MISTAIYTSHRFSTKESEGAKANHVPTASKENKQKGRTTEMANKYVVALLAVCLLNVAVAIKAEEDLKARQERCFNYCYNACIWPAKFCRWACGARCENPIGMDNYDEEKPFPVPTEEDYKRYLENNAPAPKKH